MDFAFCPVCAAGMTVLSAGQDRGRQACPQGHFVHYDNPAVTAFAFVEREGRYLVLERAQEPYRGLWDLPGGFVDVAFHCRGLPGGCSASSACRPLRASLSSRGGASTAGAP